ncbi:MAG: 4Fe-4S binding protein [Acidobacteriia bacterium]|nr:4Fe-4S binding protein [Terriglobia bacterium]
MNHLIQVSSSATKPAASRDSVSEPWVETIRQIALVVFFAVPLVGVLFPARAGRLVWTVTIAALPLFIVLVGYHRWRRICPLSFFSRLPNRLGWSGSRKASAWLEANYYLVAFTVFLACLWLRLVATNGNGHAIAVFFVMITMAAFAFGMLFTGKTWCNHVCPVSFIEKIYTEPRSLLETPNSQCPKCTGCKKSCPDINEENGYWKEIDSSPKRTVYFCYPGLVFGFYFYYFLQSATWEYYFGGRWTNEPSVLHTAFLPGHDPTTAGFFFFPAMPRAVASFLTLSVCALVSFAVFSTLEKFVERRRSQRNEKDEASMVRHWLLAIAAFTAFVTFYSFAGAPTLRLIPGLPHITAIAVVTTATLFIARRLPRTQKIFAEESLARNIVARWPWADMAPPKNLKDAFLIYTIRSHESSEGYGRLLQIYQDAVRDSLADGLVTRETVNILLSFRSQLQIKQADHEKVMAELAEEERQKIHRVTEVSVEKTLQLRAYAAELRQYFDRVLAAGGSPNDDVVKRLQTEFRVTKEEHAAVLFELSDDAGAASNYMVLAFLESQATSMKRVS